MSYKTLCVLGLGYIGLPTATMFAKNGMQVVGVDINSNVIETVNRGDIHIFEPGLRSLVKSAVINKNLCASLQPSYSDAFIIAVPTPFLKSNKQLPEPDLSYIRDACRAIAPFINKGNLIILESTSPVGTTEKIRDELARLRPDLRFPNANNDNSDVNIAYCPERVLPGNIVDELVNNDRIIGGITQKCSNRASELYKNFVKGECFLTNARTAELTKLTENASRDVQIAFANELSLICNELDVNVWDLISLANKHPRVNILSPGPGVGGHCIAVDPWFTIHSAPTTSRLHRLARNINDEKPAWVTRKVKKLANTHPDKKVAFFGLSYKPNIDDFRESPAVKIVRSCMSELGNEIIVVEPYADARIESEFLIQPVEKVDFQIMICVMLVPHKEFSDCPRPSLCIDTVGLWN